MRIQGTTREGQMPLPNIRLNKGKYAQSGKEITNHSTIPDKAALARFMQTSPNNQCSMLWGSNKQLFPYLCHMYMSRGDKTLLINMHKRLDVCNPTAC